MSKATDYTKLKNAELEALLKQRNLPHSGKKAELVKRLEESDAQGGSKHQTEDEIDWDDEPSTNAANKNNNGNKADQNTATADTTAKPSSTVEQNGQSKPTESKASVEPSNQDKAAEAQKISITTENADSTSSTTAAKPEVSYSAGLASTSIDDELARRAARAKKFGMPVDEEVTKALERAKKFGSNKEPEKGDTPNSVGGLDKALPEKRGRGEKRDRKDENGDGRVGEQKKVKGGVSNEEKKNENKPKSGGNGISAADKEAAERRKARFATTAAS